MKPDARAYATGLWAQRRGFALPADAEAAQQALISTAISKGCVPIGPDTEPAIAAWWGKRAAVPRAVERAVRSHRHRHLPRASAPSASCGEALVAHPRRLRPSAAPPRSSAAAHGLPHRLGPADPGPAAVVVGIGVGLVAQ
jgi:hypothetical protein